MNIKSIRLDYPRVESVPQKTWRDLIKAGKPVGYSLAVSGLGHIVWEDDSTDILDIQFSFKANRTNSMGGLLARDGWKFQPSRSTTLAQALTKADVSAKGAAVEAFELDTDGKIVFDEPGLSDEQASQGLPLLAYHVTGKSLLLTNVSAASKTVTKRDGGEKEIVDVSSAKLATIDTPAVTADFGVEEDVPVVGIVNAAARKAKATPATMSLS